MSIFDKKGYKLLFRSVLEEVGSFCLPTVSLRAHSDSLFLLSGSIAFKSRQHLIILATVEIKRYVKKSGKNSICLVDLP